jgi:hypothetical protein
MMFSKCCNFLCIVLIQLVTSGSSWAENNKFLQDRFVIGLWNPPATSVDLAERYKEIAEANFNLVIKTAGTTAQEQLELCKRFGLNALINADGPPEKFPDGPACWGYHLADEPGPGSFPGLASRTEAIPKSHPGRLAYVNLLPNYAPNWAVGDAGYEEYVARFIREVKADVLSMDHYPSSARSRIPTGGAQLSSSITATATPPGLRWNLIPKRKMFKKLTKPMGKKSRWSMTARSWWDSRFR